MVQVLKKDEVHRLLSAPSANGKWGRRDRALLSVMALGGLRIAEATGLTRDNISIDKGVTRLTFAGKGGKVRTVTLPRRAAVALDATLKDFPGPYVFYSHDHTKPLSTRGARYVVQQWFDHCRFEAWVHCHSLRHSCATALLRATDIRTVQRTLGHSSPVTTSKYYDGWDITDTDRAAEALNRAFA